MDSTHAQKSMCPYTSECLRLLDEIDAYGMTRGWSENAASFTETTGDLHIEQLAMHLKSCLICQASVAGARRARDTQRRMLRSVLVESESSVPSVTNSILTAIRQESAHPRKQPDRVDISAAREYPVSTPMPLVPTPVSGRQRQRSRSRLGTLLALTAAAVIILASISLFGSRAGLFGQEGHSPTRPGTGQNTVTVKIAPASSFEVTSGIWPAVLFISTTANGQQNSAGNYDTVNGKTLQLLQACCTKNIAVDGVAHKGDNLVYRTWDDHQTNYHLLTGRIYTVPGRGSNAVWSTYNDTLYASTADTLYVFDAHTTNHIVQSIHISLNADRLESYQINGQGQSYLYFSRLSSVGRSLFRIPVNPLVATSAVNGPLATASPGSLFWFGQDTAHKGGVYYVVNKNLFFADLGTGVEVPVSINAVPVGYNTADGSSSLLYVQQTQTGAFQLINADDKAVLMDNILPTGAVSLCQGSPSTDRIPICDGSIALNPFNTQFVYGASYPDGSYKMFTSDWQTKGTPVPISIPTNQLNVQLLGWDSIVPK